ncbi:NADH dehydrogenase [ubiquinone] 1 alpha subcomplex subunit 8 [Strongyloides ratti]|uniref:NADH dehydrogenase [ubiquinone] 1 alpha subcomplex subunit 8 n=1 Tax=Strongyloides ratti TaxID=34506 RepID=A0A090LCP2_STRRB|nr:NADH dehydrogenase [ubiquinone] 1 alpha subcomplex subunit 8 [Strongyloides ratti]CEF65255.1 NADH dehydrogenase [ubiquinone] 1 alpha subcomplex subunit 8 [Strongyloides ratti]
MTITNEIKLPSDEELKVDQEITLSTPWMKAVAPYMARACEQEAKEFMLRRKELEDPRLVLKEGAALTNCGIAFLQKLKKTCAPDVEKYANCIDYGSSKLYASKCREEQRFVDRCIEEELKIERPKLGYFSKIHVHESVHPKPQHPKFRDYKKEAAEVLKSLPEDYHLRKDYKRFQDWRTSLLES